MENKQHICDLLLAALQATRHCRDLVSLEYVVPEQPNRYESYVVATFDNGYSRSINTSMDSGIAMIRDICEHVQ